VLNKAADGGVFEGTSLRPEREYSHPHGTAILADQPRNPGALQRLARVTI
jgi:hypothetical protein